MFYVVYEDTYTINSIFIQNNVPCMHSWCLHSPLLYYFVHIILVVDVREEQRIPPIFIEVRYNNNRPNDLGPYLTPCMMMFRGKNNTKQYTHTHSTHTFYCSKGKVKERRENRYFSYTNPATLPHVHIFWYTTTKKQQQRPRCLFIWFEHEMYESSPGFDSKCSQTIRKNTIVVIMYNLYKAPLTINEYKV